jgi:hypothetical protein
MKQGHARSEKTVRLTFSSAWLQLKIVSLQQDALPPLLWQWGPKPGTSPASSSPQRANSVLFHPGRMAEGKGLVIVDGWDHPEFDWLIRGLEDAPVQQLSQGVTFKTVSMTIGRGEPGQSKYEFEFETYIGSLDPAGFCSMRGRRSKRCFAAGSKKHCDAGCGFYATCLRRARSVWAGGSSGDGGRGDRPQAHGGGYRPLSPHARTGAPVHRAAGQARAQGRQDRSRC